MAKPSETFLIWQWNCRGFPSKKASLQQYIRCSSEKPLVILLQETLTPNVTLTGYKPVSRYSDGRGVCTLVSNKLTHISHDLKMATSSAEYVMTEILPRSSDRSSIFFLNVYSSPKDRRQRFRALIKKAVNLAGPNPLVVAGDFNAPHHTWGYPYNTSKGAELWQNATDMDLTLITDKAFPTRLGTSSCRDSTPDLTFVKNLPDVQWANSNIDLGSDHYVLVTQFLVVRKRAREFSWTNWDQFRKVRNDRPLPATRPSLQEWISQLREDVISTTKNISTDLPVEKMDSRLAHLLEAKQSLLARWKGQRLNRRLRKKISDLNKTIEEHCRVLSKQQWDEVCNSVDGQMRNGKTWNLLKHLLSETNTKTNQRNVLARAMHEAKQSSSEEEVLKQLVQKYLPVDSNPATTYPEYSGPANTELDAEICHEEVRQALYGLNGRSAAGPDGITNKTLRNLDDRSIDYLTEVINEAWKSGEVPDPWKVARTVLIPKPGRSPNLDNMRPISLTSCVGKVAEHVVLNRLTRYLEDNGLYPYTMIGFRAKLSTQDAMKLLKHQVIDCNTRDMRAILGLDLEKAFDNVTHSFVLRSIAELGLGVRFYKYVKSFLTRRRATLSVGDLVSEEIELGSRGTPQGSVISPTLFNLVMVGLSKRLSCIEGINHTIYADDITIWCTGGSDGQVERSLQEAIDTTEDYLRPTGLRCSPSKSELLLYQPTRRGPKPKNWQPISKSDIKLYTGDGSAIPRVDSIRVLGMTIESNGSNGKTILKLAAKTDNAVRLVRRVANRYQGLKEDNLIRLVNAFVLCHFSYVAAMHNWQRAERDKINVLLRKITKRALGIPIRTRTERLLQLGVHNTLEEIAEAQERAQLARLSSSQTGRHILRELGHSPAEVDEKMRQVPREIRDLITVAPIPRNVHPEHNRGRRRARAATLLKQIHSEEHGVSFVDAAAYRGSRAFSAVVVDSKQQITNCASVHTDDPTIAEQVAIALAILEGEREVIYSDSRSAIRAFERGVISKKALRVLQSGGRDGIKHHVLIWFPAHVGQVQGAPPNLNESAHEAARALTDRAGSGQRFGANGVAENRDAPATYNEITKYFYLARRLYPLPHPNLNRPQALTLRRL